MKEFVFADDFKNIQGPVAGRGPLGKGYDGHRGADF